MKKIYAGLFALMLAAAALPACVYAQVSTGQKVAASDIPSVFQVFATANATITFPKFTVDAKLNVLPQYVGLSPQVIKIVGLLEKKIDINNGDGEDLGTASEEVGAMPGINKSDLAAAVSAINYPEKYAEQESFSEKTIIQSGSSFAIDEDGYLVTNAHVVDVSSDDVEQALINDFQQSTGTDELFALPSVISSSDDVDLLQSNFADYLDQYAVLASSTVGYKVLPPSVTRSDSYDNILNDGWDASLVYKGEPYPGKDVALLKLSLNYKIPALDLSSINPSVGDSVYDIGFPGDANLTEQLENQATFTGGTVSAVRKSDSGDFSVFQTDVSAGDGSSGGPVLNAAGDVVGVLTLSSEGDASSGNFNFFLPVSLVRGMLSTANVSLNPSRTATNAYHQGVVLLESGNCATGKASIATLQNSLNSDFISQMTALCVPTAPRTSLSPWWADVAAIIILIIAALSFWYHRRLAAKKV